MNRPKRNKTSSRMDAFFVSLKNCHERIDNLKTDILNEANHEIGEQLSRQLEDFKVDVRHTLMRIEQEAAGKIADIKVPTADWRHLAEGIIKRQNALEVNIARSFATQAAHEEVFRTLGVWLKESVTVFFEDSPNFTIYTCDGCGNRFDYENMRDETTISHPAFCPICGRKIARVERQKRIT